MDLFFHASPKKFRKIIKAGKKGYVCVTKNELISGFGNWIYILDVKKIVKDFKVERYVGKGQKSRFYYSVHTHKGEYNFLSDKLKSEYRIFGDINLDKYCIGIVKHFDMSKGLMEEQLITKVMKRLEFK